MRLIILSVLIALLGAVGPAPAAQEQQTVREARKRAAKRQKEARRRAERAEKGVKRRNNELSKQNKQRDRDRARRINEIDAGRKRELARRGVGRPQSAEPGAAEPVDPGIQPRTRGVSVEEAARTGPPK